MKQSFDEQAKVWDQKKDRLARAQVIGDKIRARVPLSPSFTALEFGCGTGLLGFTLLDAVGHLTFSDTSTGMLDQVNRKIQEGNLAHARTLDLNRTSLGGPYDLVFSLMVLHHIEDFRGQIRALVRATKVGGYLCLGDLDREDGSFHAPETVPHNGFDRSQIEALFLENGVEPLESSTGYVNRKMIGTQEREFPVFLVIGRRR